MGYLSDYIVTASEEVLIEIVKESGYSDWVDELYNFKWYGCEKDCRKVSKMFPDQVILVEGNGEEHGDVWQKYFKNGKCVEYRPKVIWPEFDEKDLK